MDANKLCTQYTTAKANTCCCSCQIPNALVNAKHASVNHPSAVKRNFRLPCHVSVKYCANAVPQLHACWTIGLLRHDNATTSISLFARTHASASGFHPFPTHKCTQANSLCPVTKSKCSGNLLPTGTSSRRAESDLARATHCSQTAVAMAMAMAMPMPVPMPVPMLLPIPMPIPTYDKRG